MKQPSVTSDDMKDEPRGPRFVFERTLLGKKAASLFFELRAEANRNRDPARRSINLPDRDAWVVTTDDWPTDGTWRPSPDAIPVLFGKGFQAAFKDLGKSLLSQPLTETKAYRNLVAAEDKATREAEKTDSRND